MYDYNIYKRSVYIFHVELNIRWRVIMCSAPHGHWFEQASVGGSKSDCLKQGASAQNALSCFSFSSLSNSRMDDPEAGPLDSCLNIGWDKLSRRIKDFANTVTSQNQQRHDALHLNAEPASNSNTAPRWRHATAAEIPRATRWNGTKDRATRWNGTKDRRNTWKHTWKRDKDTACLIDIKQVSQTKSLITELWIDLYAVAFLMLVIFLLV